MTSAYGSGSRRRRRRRGVLVAAVVAATAAAALAESPRPGIDWPGFRGIAASGVAEGYATAVRFDRASGEGIRFAVELPGLAHSSPAIWGDAIFVTTAIAAAAAPELKVGLYGNIQPTADDGSQRFELLCLDKSTGELRWRTTAYEGPPRVRRHPKSTHANPTPATDGRRVVSFFGSEGLYCHDLEGRLLWRKDFGVLDSGFFMVPAAQWGFASSPVIQDGRVIVQVDVQKDGFLAVYDLETGAELWRVARDEVPTWGSPTVWQQPDRALVLVNGYRHIGAYDFATGAEVWRLTGGGDIPVPTPVFAHDLVFITSAHGGMAPVYAVRAGASGDISLEGDARANAGVAWSVARDGGYMQTPIVYGDLLYVGRDNGVVTAFDARTGEVRYQARVGDGGTGFTSSPVAADGKLYFVSELGDVVVVRAGPVYEELASSELGEIHMATPAISEGVLYFRTRSHLVAVEPPSAATAPGAR